MPSASDYERIEFEDYKERRIHNEEIKTIKDNWEVRNYIDKESLLFHSTVGLIVGMLVLFHVYDSYILMGAIILVFSLSYFPVKNRYVITGDRVTKFEKQFLRNSYIAFAFINDKRGTEIYRDIKFEDMNGLEEEQRKIVVKGEEVINNEIFVEHPYLDYSSRKNKTINIKDKSLFENVKEKYVVNKL